MFFFLLDPCAFTSNQQMELENSTCFIANKKQARSAMENCNSFPCQKKSKPASFGTSLVQSTIFYPDN